MPAHQGFHSSHKPGIQHCIVMIVAVTEAMERAPEHSLRLIEAAAPRDQALLDLGDCQMRTIFRIPTFPKDETEALLAAQMAAIHNATMVAARRLYHVETIPQQDSASNMLNKLARTFAAQVEALKKYRSAGEQTIKVQHVTVNEGGQAIVGNVNQGGGDTANNGDQPHEPCAAAECGPALLSHEQTVPAQMSSAGRPRLEGVPVSRGAGRGTKGQG